MPAYKIYILDRRGRIVRSFDFEGQDDLSAVDESRKHSRTSAVEVWQRARMVARIQQGEAWQPQAPTAQSQIGEKARP